jgi:hypothetical protein
VLWTLAALLIFGATTAVHFADTWRHDPRRAVPVHALYGDRTDLGARELMWTAISRADATFAAWLVGRNARTLLEAPLRLFDTEHCAPARRTMTLGEPMITMGLLGVPFLALTGDPVLTYNLVLVAQWLIGAMAMYALIVAWTREPAAGIVAGLLYTFHPAHASDITHPFIYDTAWTVLALLFAQRLFAHGRWRDAVGLGLCTVLQLGTSFYPFLAAFFLVPPYLAWLVYRYGVRRAGWSRLLLAGVIVAAGVLVVGGPYLAARASPDALRRGYFFYEAWASFLPGRERFPGWIALPLIVAALALGRRRAVAGLEGDPRWALVLGAALVALAATGGRPTSLISALRGDPQLPFRLPDIYALVASIVPGLDAIRNVAQLRAGVHLAAMLLAGMGTAAVLRLGGRRWAAGAGAVLVALALVEALRPTAFGLPQTMRWDTVEVRPADATLAFYRALHEGGNAGPLVEVPMARNAVYRFGFAIAQISASGWHHRRTSGCFGSYRPPEHERLREICDRLPAPDAIRALHDLGFTTIVAHEGPAGSLRTRLDSTASDPAGALRPLHATPFMSAYAIASP